MSDNIYYKTDNGTLYCGDCREIIPTLLDGVVDLVLTDPPYNIADNGKLTKVGGEVVSTEKAWGNQFVDYWQNFNDYADWIIDIFKSIEPKMSNDASLIAFFDRKYTGYFADALENNTNLIYRNKLYFIKNNPLPHIRKNNYRSCVEESIWFSKQKYHINFLSQDEMKQVFYGNIGSKHSDHPTEKYFWMINPLIIRHSEECDTVLDPFAGSGTTAVACEKLNRKWICIEKDERYCEMAKQRIESVVKLGDLFKSVTENKTNNLTSKPDGKNLAQEGNRIADLSWTKEKAIEARNSLLQFEEDWNAQGMEDYDNF